MVKEDYNHSIEECLKLYESDKKGITQIFANKQLNKYGTNELDTKSEVKALDILLDQFKDFITYILLVAVIITLFIREYTNAILIITILIINAIIGFYQEYNAKKSLEALKNMVKIKAKVYRDSNLKIIESKDLVPGDIVTLEAGDKIPADGRIIENFNLEIQESALTGEVQPVEKTTKTFNNNLSIGDQKNMAFYSTIVTKGNGKILVTKTGMNTQIGKITQLVKDAKEEMTPLQIKLDRFGKWLGKIIIGIAIFVFLFSLLKQFFTNGKIPTEFIYSIFLLMISLMVAAVPTGLPIVVTVALSNGVKKMAKKKALVRKLPSVETLGSCNVICSDKTGTLTKNEMTVRKIYTYDQEAKVEGIGYNPRGTLSEKIPELIFKIASICNDSSIYKENNLWKISGDPTEAALLVSSKKAGFEYKTERIDELPFDSQRKLMSVLIKENNKKLVYTKGAPDIILNKCNFYIKNNKKHKLTKEIKEEILNKNLEYSQNAMRVLGFAYKEIKDKKGFTETDLTFVGLQAMIDPPRPDVIDAIKKTKSAGIRVIMITGDYKETAKAIGNKVGIEGNVITGYELEKLNDDELKEQLANNTNIFARVIPEHKQRIVKTLQENGDVVAMTGDGVNDAPALKKANIGIAVGSGTDVAKEAADFVLLDDSFSHVVNAVEEGRGIYDNIQKSIQLLLSGNLTEVLIVFLAALFFPTHYLPLTAVMLLWINLITDGAPAIAFGFDPYDKFIMKKKPRSLKENILPLKQALFIIIRGIIGTGIALLLFYHFAKQNLNLGQSTIFTFMILYEASLIYVIRGKYNVKILSNKWLILAVLFSIISQLLVLYTPLHTIFSIIPLQLENWISIIFALMTMSIFYFIYDIIEEKILEPKFKKLQ